MKNDATTYCESRIEQLGFSSQYKNLLEELVTEWPEQVQGQLKLNLKQKQVKEEIQEILTAVQKVDDMKESKFDALETKQDIQMQLTTACQEHDRLDKYVQMMQTKLVKFI